MELEVKLNNRDSRADKKSDQMTTQIDFNIRKPTFDNAEVMAHILCASWKDAYQNILTKDELDKLTNEQSRKEMFVRLLKNSVENYWILYNEEVPCGLIYFCASRDTDMKDFAEVAAIYTLKEYWSKGAGKIIMDFAISEVRKIGYKKVMLWVFEENHRARKFYEKNGFTCENTFKVSKFGSAREVRYIRHL